MSKWRITIEHEDDDGLRGTSSKESSWHSEEGQTSELRCIAINLAECLCAFEALGVTVAESGEEVLDAFEDMFRESYHYWNEMKIEPEG